MKPRIQQLLVGALVCVAPFAARAASEHLVFSSFQEGALTGHPGAPPIQVSIVDASGATDTTSSAVVTLALALSGVEAQLLGTRSVQAVAGVATFDHLSIDRPGDGFVFIATSPGLPPSASRAFSFAPAADPRDPLGYGCTSGGAASILLVVPLVFFVLRRRRAWPALLILCALVPGARAAKARTQVVDARALNARGLDEFKLQHYDAALTFFEEARRGSDEPKLLYNIAECHRLSGRTDEALAAYHQYLDRVPEEKRADVTALATLEMERNQRATPPMVAPAIADEEPPAGTFHAPGVALGASWDPIGHRMAGEALAQLRLGGSWQMSAGALLAPKIGGRVMIEHFLWENDDFSVSAGLRGLIAPARRGVFAGGGPALVLRARGVIGIDLYGSVSAEAFRGGGESFLLPVVTGGIAGHL